MESPSRWHVSSVVGIAFGGLLSVLPIFVVIICCLLMLAIFGMRMCSVRTRGNMVMLVSMIIMLLTASALPYKELDISVGPMNYHDVTLADLCDRLYEDYGIVCHVYGDSSRTTRLSFCTISPLSRKDVLEKLSHETNRPLHIGYCGSSGSVLFGASPSFTYLGEEGDVKCNRKSQ
jgi:hypothetical protein